MLPEYEDSPRSDGSHRGRTDSHSQECAAEDLEEAMDTCTVVV